jgi:hypothetical protein
MNWAMLEALYPVYVRGEAYSGHAARISMSRRFPELLSGPNYAQNVPAFLPDVTRTTGLTDC